MQLVMIGVADMRASIDIDDTPFLRRWGTDVSPFPVFPFLRKWVSAIGLDDPSKPALPHGLRDAIAKALMTLDIDYSIPEAPFPTWPLIGRGLEFRLKSGAPLVARLKRDAIQIVDLECVHIKKAVDVWTDSTKKSVKTIEFDKEKMKAIIKDAEISLKLRVYAIGFAVIRITIDSSNDQFNTYWYPVSDAIEVATYDRTKIFDRDMPKEWVENLGSINTALRRFEKEICRHYQIRVTRDTSRRKIDEIESGFQIVIRARCDENTSDAFAIADAINSPGGMQKTSTTKRDAYLGWAAILLVSKDDHDSDKPIFNAEICVLIHDLFLSYQNFLAEYLAAHVFSGKPISKKADVESQRRFGDALFHLADLRRGSSSGSDLAFYETWISVTQLDSLRKKTSDGLDAIVARIEGRAKRRTDLWATRLALITGAIGLTSLVGFLNGLHEYLEEPRSGHTITTLLHLKYLSPPGLDILGAYALVIASIAAVWLYTRGFERK